MKEKWAGDRAMRRSRRYGSGVGKVPRGYFQILGDIQRWRCACGCGRNIRHAYHVDHIIPLAKGGRHEVGNLQLLAPVCNLKKAAKV